MPIFLLEPNRGRVAISVSAKCACTTARMWLWELGFGEKYTGYNIFKTFDAYTVPVGEALPGSVEVAIAIHREGVGRMRAVYDHRIRRRKEAADFGLDHFAKHLPEYCALSPVIAHHCQARSEWLGSDLEAFTDIIPMERLDLIVDIVREMTGAEPPELPKIHGTPDKTPVSAEAEHWLRQWTAYDTALGWDGQLLRLFE